MSNPLNSKSRPEPKGGWTLDDRTRRCITDNCGYGKDSNGAWVGTPLSMIYISVHQKDAANIVVARAGVCMKCGRLYSLTLRLDPETHNQVAAGLGITRDGIERCLRASKNATQFDLEELRAGRMNEVALTPAVLELMAKRAHGGGHSDGADEVPAYNPDAFIEPEQEVLPF